MHQSSDIPRRYAYILERVALESNEFVREQALAEAFELGRSLLASDITPDDIVNLHHRSLSELALQHPQLSLGDVGPRLTLSLLELTMAHGMSFREQLQRRHEAQFASRIEQASRLEALGTLAAGIAHDFNTLLGSIRGYAELTGDQLPAGSAGSSYLNQIQLACDRAHSLIQRMLAFAREQPSELVAQTLVNELKDAIAILEPGLPKSIRLHVDDRLGRARILAAPGHVQQMVLNLCLNAVEAMPAGGDLSIRLEPARQQPDVPVARADDVCLSVTDTGIGMPPEVQARVFEPFFTTRAPRGSGLGLSVVYGIVRQLGGEITLSSRSSGPDTGTTFRIFLPCLATGEADPVIPEEPSYGAHPDY